MLRTPLGRLRWVALAEGVSYVLLLAVAMPLKYVFGIPEWVRFTGMAHGVLFIAFAAALFHAHIARRWTVMFSIAVFISSLIPLGAFYMERRLAALTDSDGSGA